MDYKAKAAAEAVTLVKGQSIIGLGAGSTIAQAVNFLKQRIEKGLQVKIVTSSLATQELLHQQGIDTLNIQDLSSIDLYLDGCDQFDKDLHALKSGGGIHTHEKLLAIMAREFVIVGDDTKYSEKFSTKFPLVIEVIPEALQYCTAMVNQVFKNVKTTLRTNDKRDGAIITSNGNYLIDCWFKEWPVLAGINPTCKQITGVVETSLFYNMAHKAVIAGEAGIRILEKKMVDRN